MKETVRALLDSLIDYAGLFPPAGLDMRTAVENYSRYRAGDHRECLGRFIVPLSRVGEFEQVFVEVDPAPVVEWQLSVLVSADLESDADLLAAFNERYDGRATIDAIEVKASTDEEIAMITATALPEVTRFIEVPLDGSLPALIAAIAAEGARAKIRTGGITADAFPSARDVVRFLEVCAREGVAFKATAGLHHPLRCVRPLTYEPDSPSGTMHGFVNLFLAAVLLQQEGDSATAESMLSERDPASFSLRDDLISWRGHELSLDAIEWSRESFANSFGSCSFEEPIADLQAIGWVEAAP